MFKYVGAYEGITRIISLTGLGQYKICLTHTGKLHMYVSDSANNIASCTWTYIGDVIDENNIDSYDVHVQDGRSLVIIYKNRIGQSKVAIWPGDFPLYGPKDPYRLYYGVDSETLYMNVENRWVPVSYLDHNKMNGAGTLSHEQLESALLSALERINALEQQLNN